MPNATPLIDTHVHFWDPSRLSYPWLKDFPDISRRHLPADYLAEMGSQPLAGMVFVECNCLPEETEAEVAWVTALAQAEPRLRGIVAYCEIAEGDAARPQLERLAVQDLVKGIRRNIQQEPDASVILQPDFLAGVRAVGDVGLSFDLCFKHYQLPQVTQLVQQCPEVFFILDHLGKPAICDGNFDPWRAELKELADCTNVVAKISGMITEADFKRWTVDDLKPYFEHMVTCFGPERLMFGGDWPVLRLASNLGRWVEVLDELTVGWYPGDRNRLFHNNAVTYYRLD
jgi:L-fuconolactonase